jgi:hypothetical protein
VERSARLSSGQESVGLGGLGARTLGVDGDDAIDRLVERGNAREEIFERFSAGDPSSTYRSG